MNEKPGFRTFPLRLCSLPGKFLLVALGKMERQLEKVTIRIRHSGVLDEKEDCYSLR